MTEEKPKAEPEPPPPVEPTPDDHPEPKPGERFFSPGSECWHDPKTGTFHI